MIVFKDISIDNNKNEKILRCTLQRISVIQEFEEFN